jgi:hypothetical protein
MTTLGFLVAARAKIAQGWTQRVYARDARDRAVMYDSPAATCWCLNGALASLAWTGPDPELVEAYRLVRAAAVGDGAEFPFEKSVKWNDAPGRTQAEVLAAFDRAIALAATPEPRP